MLVPAVAGGFAVAVLINLTYAVPAVERTDAGWTRAIWVPFARAAAVAAALAVAWWVVRRYRPLLRGRGVAVAVAALLGASFAAGALAAGPDLLRIGKRGRAGEAEITAAVVTEAEMRAARWLEAHAGEDDVVATTVHCRPVQTVPGCPSIAFWVAGLGGRRTLIESWAYTGEAVAMGSADGVHYTRRPPPDPERYTLNERRFTHPDAAVARRLHDEYGVRWLFADTRAGPVAEATLASLAEPRFTAGPVTIYELRQ